MKTLVERRILLAGLFLLLVPLVWFWPVVVGGKTLLPADNLYQFQPWADVAAEVGVDTPHNELLNDLLLENYVWKSYLREAIGRGELPLWNPYLFAGVPFLAAGQHSALYPFTILFYILPLPLAYGVFTWLQLALAAIGMALFARVLRLGWAASLFAGLAYAFSSFFVASVVFTMIISAAAWLPWLLASIEMVIRKQEEKGDVAYSPAPYVIAGALVLGLQTLAGHPEVTVLTLLTAGFYAGVRLLVLARRTKAWRRALRLGLWLLGMVVAGLALGAIQLIPLLELVGTSFREGSVSYDQVVGWAWPSRQLLTFFLPDFFGNPSHHGWYDPWLRAWRSAGPNALGAPVRDVFWGVKNYVEGANYLGIITLLLAALAVLGALTRLVVGRKATPPNLAKSPAGNAQQPLTSQAHIWIFAALAVLSLLFAFGTPLYAILFYGVPGYKQLHSAFRWVWPYTLAMTALAGYGLQMLLDATQARRFGQPQALDGQPPGLAAQPYSSREDGLPGVSMRVLAQVLAVVAILVGAVTLAAVLASLVLPDTFVAVGQRIVDSSDLAQGVFADGQAFWSYQWRNVGHFGLFALLAGLGLLVLVRTRRVGVRRGAISLLFVLLLADLWLILGDFNPSVDPTLLDNTPSSVTFLQSDEDLWRLTTLEGSDTSKTFNANTPWLHGLQDVRGYDSIIPERYVAYMEAIEPQGQLLYNRISPFYDPASLSDPLTDLLGVKYVMTELALDTPGWELAYDDEVRIYRNDQAFPRAFLVGEARTVPAAEVLDLVRQVDLRDIVVLEADQAGDAEPGASPAVPGETVGQGNQSPPSLLPQPAFARPPSRYDGRLPPQELPPPASPQLRTATVSRYDLRQVFVDLNLSDRGWLVLTDAWFPGWKAYLRPFGETREGVDADGNPLEQELPVFRANGNFRAVYLPQAGQWTVRFVYSPRSVQLGIYVSFLAFISLLLLGGSWAWGRYYREADDEDAVVRIVAKNSAVQMVLSLLNRAIDFAFAMLRLRVLGPSGEGSYAFAVAVYGFFEILVRFGLGTLLTRDVAQDKEDAGRYLVNVMALRGLLWLLSLPLMGLVMLGYAATGNLSPQEAQAIGLFAIGLFFATLADSFSAVFIAYEKMEYPAGIASTIVVLKVALGAFVILPPLNWGFVGLAGVSVVTNIIQAAWLWIVLRRHIPMRFTGVERPLQRAMLIQSYPLMLNHLLASVFWRIDLWILKPLAGAAAVGIYSAAVKYLDGLNVIPSYFTLAIFPLMSRYARDSHESLVRAYRLALRLLVLIALPIAITVTLLATPLIRILGGAAYLPDSAIALQILIWSIPVGFINSVTQYVLIAVGQQRFLTKAFVIGVAFNIVANLIFIPRYGYRAAAVITVLSEFSLLIPFYLAVRRHVATVPWVAMLWRQVLAAALMGLVCAGLASVSLWLATGVGWMVYGLLLILLGTFRDEDMQRVRRALPLVRRGSNNTGES
jgi:O-antigen/teichoic acid export membrane protein